MQFDREVAIIEPLDLQLMYTQLSKPINRCDIVLESNQALITLSIDDYKLAMHIMGTQTRTLDPFFGLHMNQLTSSNLSLHRQVDVAPQAAAKAV
jgi:hypothetical protein